MSDSLSFVRAFQLLRYDPLTGGFVWRERRGRMRAGSKAGAFNALGYLEIRIEGRLYLGHRLAWLLMTGEWPASQVDHQNVNPSDNRWVNLRASTHGQNQANQPIDKANTSGFKGVSWNKEKSRWETRIQIRGKSKFLGYFHKIEEAARAYRQAAELHFGEFARVA